MCSFKKKCRSQVRNSLTASAFLRFLLKKSLTPIPYASRGGLPGGSQVLL
jgi:hypothetical protein